MTEVRVARLKTPGRRDRENVAVLLLTEPTQNGTPAAEVGVNPLVAIPQSDERLGDVSSADSAA
jgi:hypothetical protein